ncbi:MAG: sigma-70 family RNA polymerase sigma factor [Bryobacterales bacterium]|nr:sigma-70 family RNA polymerase sigma factor [Bryobacterales bacterium]
MEDENQQQEPQHSEAGQSVTQLLHAWKNGNEAALGELTPIVYDELLRIARRQLRAERSDHTLAPTALVHEAWMRMLNQNRADWRDRTHFFALAARFMRRILVDYSRNHKAQKRGGAAVKISMDEGFDVGQPRDASIAALDDALTALAEFDDRKAKVIELRYFGGLTVNEIADHLAVSVATVGRELRVAQAWLHREMCATE